MKEVEVKILEVNRQKITDMLASLNARKVFDGEIFSVFLDFHDGTISRKKDVLRLRKEQEKVELTYKKVQASKTAKVAEEFSVQVSDLDAMVKILQNLGLTVTQKMQKHRTSYMLENIRFDLDRYSGDYRFIPEFLEIEGSFQGIKKYANYLGFQSKDCLTWSTDELIQHYSNKEKG
jgi:adenylate cyclase class 2